MRQSDVIAKAMSFLEFTSLSKGASKNMKNQDETYSRELNGYFTWRNDSPDYLFFGQYLYGCPNVPIHKDDVERVMPNKTFQCAGNPGQMWSGIVTLKEGSKFDLKTADRLYLQALPVSADQDLAGCAPTFIWFSLEANLKRSLDGWVWGKWSDDIKDTCQGLGLHKPLDMKDILRFGVVGACNSDRIFLAEVPKYSR